MNHIPLHLIDKWAADLLDEEEKAQVEQHAERCSECKEKLGAARAARETFLRANPPEIRAKQLLAMNKERPKWRFFTVPAFAAALAISLVLFLPSAPEEIRFKGAKVTYEIQRDNKEWNGKSGEQLRAGDAIQIRAYPEQPSYITLFSVDERGNTTRLLSTKLEKPGPLPKRLVLDDDLTAERLFVVTAESSVPLDLFREAVQNALSRSPFTEMTVKLQIEAQVSSFLVRKEKPPTPEQPGVHQE